jgi:ATP-dependent Lhr-like helicase
VSHFDRLHPALQHHIVNSLGWREIRPFQEAVIPSILAGHHLLIIAPTAGGKTEAALFPLLSRMLSDGWSGLSVVYICPIKALLNNLDIRLQRYCSLLGRRSALWHGDVSGTARRHILLDPVDCLLTTPESLEVMLVSPNVDSRRLFSQLRAVVVDEIHAFAGDDRGWHLLSVLERITRLADREIQRIGLSATVGNPESLVDWLAGSCVGERLLSQHGEETTVKADVQLDYVGSTRNAAVVVSRLHRGQKRLVFVDSRARAEELGAELLRLGVTTFVTHSSLSREQRQAAEEAFANRENCVIVATSVLELGVDVGSLDRVIQIDSPSRVSSLLQRMGRTGRRPDTTRNCLFLATRDDALIQAAGLIDLWEEGYVEPIQPPPEPFHVLAQQVMALILQEGGIGRRTWLEWIRRVPAFSRMDNGQVEQLLKWMLQRDFLWEEQGILAIGRRGEERFGRKHFLELLSVFLSPPLYAVLHGREELGFVDELTFLGKQNEQRILLLGGRAWRVTHIDWQRRFAYVEASVEDGRSRWQGMGQGLGFRLCRAIQRLLAKDTSRDVWSSRARERLAELRQEFAWLTVDESVVIAGETGRMLWWTFAGAGGNATLATALSDATKSRVIHDSFKLEFVERLSHPDIHRAIEEVRSRDTSKLMPTVDEAALAGLKFSECLPQDLAIHILKMRLRDETAVKTVLSERIRFVSG